MASLGLFMEIRRGKRVPRPCCIDGRGPAKDGCKTYRFVVTGNQRPLRYGHHDAADASGAVRAGGTISPTLARLTLSRRNPLAGGNFIGTKPCCERASHLLSQSSRPQCGCRTTHRVCQWDHCQWSHLGLDATAGRCAGYRYGQAELAEHLVRQVLRQEVAGDS